MVLAYLRGLLEPGYPQGRRSIIRERIVLDAITSELDSKFLQTSIALGSHTLGFASKENVKGVYSDLSNKALMYRKMLELLPFEQKPEDIDASTELYYNLVEAGLISDNGEEEDHEN